MGRILALDYGLKRTGIAVTDELQIIANALVTVESNTLIDFLKNYFVKETVDKVIIGLPKNLDNTDTHGTKPVLNFINIFKKQFENMPLETIDERFTSKMAMQTLIQKGVKKSVRQDKSELDKISATIILQDYLNKY